MMDSCKSNEPGETEDAAAVAGTPLTLTLSPQAERGEEKDRTSDDRQELSSGVIIPPGEILLSDAITHTLQAPPHERAALFTTFAQEIEAHVRATAPQQPWVCVVYRGTDGSYVFRGGVGHSLVIDPEGRLWRARSYEDFLTTYTDPPDCAIDTLTPLYHQMREYVPR